jgi:hypothetical protein
MKKYYLLTVALLLPFFVFSQAKDTTYWKKGGVVNLSFSQITLTNWAAGGANSLAINGLYNRFFNYKRDKTSWETAIDIAYGVQKQGEDPVRKTDDRLELNSKYGREAFKNTYYTGLFNFRTQFQPGYKNPDFDNRISNFMAPAFITVATGLDYKPTSYFSVFFTPVSAKVTIVGDQMLADKGEYGVEAAKRDTAGNITERGKNIRTEIGATATIRFQKELIKNVTLTCNTILFNNYLDKNRANRKNIDVNVDLFLNMKINKYLSTIILAQLIYDNDVTLPNFETINGVKTQTGSSPKLQLKQLLGIGFNYKFN